MRNTTAVTSGSGTL